jgi:pyruvate,water dikinase
MNKKLILKGLGASSGQAEGIAKIFLPGSTTADFSEGDILITTITDPTMVQTMIKAGAIVTDIGGIISHPAILSREMGIPCVVNTKEGTKKIKPGTNILVDGDKGEVYELA